jgi:hypothetical protein
MKTVLIVTVLFLVAAPVFAQTQSTTNTTCTANGQQINCTSTTSTTADAAAQRAETQREINEAGANAGYALGTAIRAAKLKHDAAKTGAAEKKARAAAEKARPAVEKAAEEDRAAVENAVEGGIKADIGYCQKHPDSSVPQPSGPVLPCSEEIQQQQAFCKTSPGSLRCSQFGPPPEQTAKDNAASSAPKDQR